MTELEKFQAVNACETAEELAEVVLSFADSEGLIKGRSRMFDAQRMANNVYYVINQEAIPNLLTREFGIRQQALYIQFYKNF